jgi:general secretion pathway protein K
MMQPRGQNDSGFVLVAVLWIVAALATLASIYSAYAINTAAGLHVPDDRLQAEASIRAGVEMAVYRQLAVPEQVRPSQGGFSLRVGRTTIDVRFRSEAARIDINAAPADLLAGLFTAVGVDASSAKTFADRVIGWRTVVAPNAESKEAKLYAQWRVPYPPRQAPFENTLELSLLPGLPAPIVARVLPFVTVFSGRPTVDVATADPTVLSLLPGMTPEIMAAVLKARAAPSTDGQDLLALLGPARSRAAAGGSKSIRAAIEIAFDNGRRVRANVVFRLADSGEKPYDLLYWQDDFDGPTQSE